MRLLCWSLILRKLITLLKGDLNTDVKYREIFKNIFFTEHLRAIASARALVIKNRIKVGLSPSKKNCFICFNESPLKMMKNAFYFILKALFILKIFKFLS